MKGRKQKKKKATHGALIENGGFYREKLLITHQNIDGLIVCK